MRPLWITTFTFAGLLIVQSAHSQGKKDRPKELNLENHTPHEVLLSLQDARVSGIVSGHSGYHRPPKEWLKFDAVVELFRYVDSDARCGPAVAVSLISSFLPKEQTNIGIEARRMIEGCIEECYPGVAYDAPSTAELKQRLLEKFEAEIDKAIANQLKMPLGDKRHQKSGEKAK